MTGSAGTPIGADDGATTLMVRQSSPDGTSRATPANWPLRAWARPARTPRRRRMPCQCTTLRGARKRSRIDRGRCVRDPPPRDRPALANAAHEPTRNAHIERTLRLHPLVLRHPTAERTGVADEHLCRGTRLPDAAEVFSHLQRRAAGRWSPARRARWPGRSASARHVRPLADAEASGSPLPPCVGAAGGRW